MKNDITQPGSPAFLNLMQQRSWRTLGKLLQFLQPYRWRVVGAASALVIAAGSVLGLGQGLRLLVDAGTIGGNAQESSSWIASVFLGLITIMALATGVRYYLVTWLGERVATDLRRNVYEHLLRLSPAFYDVNRVGELQSRLTADTTLLQTVIGSSLSIALRNIITFVGSIIMLVATIPHLGLLLIICAPLAAFPVVLFARRIRMMTRKTQDHVAGLSGQIDETLHAIRNLQAFGFEPWARDAFFSRAEAVFAMARSRIVQRTFLIVMVMLLMFFGMSLVVWIGIRDVNAGKVTSGELSAFLFYALVAASAAAMIGEVVGDLFQAAGAAERLIEILNVQPQLISPVHTVDLIQPQGSITMRDIEFRYPTTPDRPAIQHFSLEVAPGERIALVGMSGAGKSTIFSLLLRFYDPQNGRILFDGHDLRHLDLKQLRQQFAWVPQQADIFATTVRENIRFALPMATDEQIWTALRLARADEFIQDLEHGLDTELGERGVRLSGGQKQRVAIARALLRNPKVLLLDEATSSLDAQSEHLVQQGLHALMHGRTTLVIAHRLATVHDAHRIVVMEGGTIQSIGDHKYLLQHSPLYAHLAALQFMTLEQNISTDQTDFVATQP